MAARLRSIGILIGAGLALSVLFIVQASAQTAQEFLLQEAQRLERPSHRAPRVRPRATRISLNVGIGGSWLERNLGAARPAGAPGPWCGYAMRLEVMSLGRPDPGPAYNAVRSWHNYGTPAPRAAIGSLFISRGHISKVVAGECPPGSVRTISGNAAGRRVSYMCEPLSSLVVSRFP